MRTEVIFGSINVNHWLNSGDTTHIERNLALTLDVIEDVIHDWQS